MTATVKTAVMVAIVGGLLLVLPAGYRWLSLAAWSLAFLLLALAVPALRWSSTTICLVAGFLAFATFHGYLIHGGGI